MVTNSTFTRPPWIVNGTSFTLISILSFSPWKRAAFCPVLGSEGSGSVPLETTHLTGDQISAQKDALRMYWDLCSSRSHRNAKPQHLRCLRQHVFVESKVPD